MYLAEGDLYLALQTKTIIVPKNFETEEEIEDIPEKKITISNYSPNLWITISASILILLIVVAGLFIKNRSTKRPARLLFKNQRDYYTLKSYIQKSLAKGIKKDKVKLVLKNKGWNTNQIDALLKDFKK